MCFIWNSQHEGGVIVPLRSLASTVNVVDDIPYFPARPKFLDKRRSKLYITLAGRLANVYNSRDSTWIECRGPAKVCEPNPRPNLSILQILSLDYLVAVYPLFLVCLTYLLVQLYRHPPQLHLSFITALAELPSSCRSESMGSCRGQVRKLSAELLGCMVSSLYNRRGLVSRCCAGS